VKGGGGAEKKISSLLDESRPRGHVQKRHATTRFDLTHINPKSTNSAALQLNQQTKEEMVFYFFW
jgi:hypothetical protein